jgi:NAD(P)-dependent dehydrogenase (short-subunit alcohol dehydrogenase family)
MKDFKGKTAFITGGASGIGFGMAKAFGRAGMNIAIADIEKDVAGRAADMLNRDQIKAIAIPCDVAVRTEVQRAALEAVAAFGKIHIVCNNAGVGAGGAFGMVGERDWDWIIDVNLKGVVYGAETFVPLIKSHGEGGHIVNTASMAGMISPPRMEPYNATKFAVVAMSEGWSQQLAEFGIGVSVLCPGFVRTRIHESGRTRQQRYGAGRDENKIDKDARAATAELIEGGLDPLIVGERVLEAIKADELYIFTHPEMKAAVDGRFDAINAAFDRAKASEALNAKRS